MRTHIEIDQMDDGTYRVMEHYPFGETHVRMHMSPLEVRVFLNNWLVRHGGNG